MTKAGKNIRFIRSGLTIQQHVAVAGEVIPLSSGFTFMSEAEQKAYYRKVFYVTTDEPVNVGPTATAPFNRVPEPLDDMNYMMPPKEENIPRKSESERGGGGGQAHIPREAQTAPDYKSVPGYEDPHLLLQLEEERKSENTAIDPHRKGRTIVLKRKKISNKKKLFKAKVTRLEKKK